MLEGTNTRYETLSGAGNCAGKVATTGVVGQIFTPRSMLTNRFFLEKVFGLGWELIELLGRDLEILVRVV